MTIEIVALPGIAEVHQGDDLAALVVAAASAADVALGEGDVLVLAQKVVSKSEGAVRDLRDVVVTERATELATKLAADPRRIQAVLDESVRVVREDRVLIVETRHGFVCANAGIDHSNVPGDHIVTLLPEDADASAAQIHQALRQLTGRSIGVIISDTFGRPWRNGLTNVALGVGGMAALIDYRGGHDDHGNPLTATVIASADELAGAAELVMGKTNRVPAVIIRGFSGGAAGTGKDLIRPADEDLFR